MRIFDYDDLYDSYKGGGPPWERNRLHNKIMKHMFEPFPHIGTVAKVVIEAGDESLNKDLEAHLNRYHDEDDIEFNVDYSLNKKKRWEKITDPIFLLESCSYLLPFAELVVCDQIIAGRVNLATSSVHSLQTSPDSAKTFIRTQHSKGYGRKFIHFDGYRPSSDPTKDSHRLPIVVFFVKKHYDNIFVCVQRWFSKLFYKRYNWKRSSPGHWTNLYAKNAIAYDIHQDEDEQVLSENEDQDRTSSHLDRRFTLENFISDEIPRRKRKNRKGFTSDFELIETPTD
ncbi:unnamed protein product [Caenorhabditis auriculariae]|uniref:Uncharacterized protein n=1 Tax=Caenorhabditis auriculariae TaxID=2777116 RepID=A0A8S1GVE5_9PELO|nr:unnamed protein product [Caenorhabditis auriculariae]